MIIRNNTDKPIGQIDVLSEEIPDGVKIHGRADLLERMPKSHSFVVHTDNKDQQDEVFTYHAKDGRSAALIHVPYPDTADSTRVQFNFRFQNPEKMILTTLHPGAYVVIDVF